jgi:hypothetical protein
VKEKEGYRAQGQESKRSSGLKVEQLAGWLLHLLSVHLIEIWMFRADLSTDSFKQIANV